MKQVGVLIAVLTLALVASSSGHSTVFRLGKSTDPQLRADATAVRAANGLLFRAGDLGTGFRGHMEPQTGAECPGVPIANLHDLTETADVTGLVFRDRTGVTVNSDAAVFVSESQAAQAFRTLKARRWQQCLEQEAKRSGMRNVRVIPLSRSVGRLQLVGWDVNATVVDKNGSTVPIEGVALAYKVGRVISDWEILGVPTRAMRQQAKLLSDLMTRRILAVRL